MRTSTQPPKQRKPDKQSLGSLQWLCCEAQLQRRALKNDELRFKKYSPENGEIETIVGLEAAIAYCSMRQYHEHERVASSVLTFTVDRQKSDIRARDDRFVAADAKSEAR